MRIGDWSSDVCSSNLDDERRDPQRAFGRAGVSGEQHEQRTKAEDHPERERALEVDREQMREIGEIDAAGGEHREHRSEEHTSELQSLMRISYAVFCLKKKIEYTHKISRLNENNKDNHHDE